MHLQKLLFLPASIINVFYSDRKLSTGLATAALMV